MQVFQNIFKCSKCGNHVESSDIVNIGDTSDKHVCRDCEKAKL